MEPFFTEQFDEAYGKLGSIEKQNVRKALTMLGENLRYPGLRVKKMEGRKTIWEARASKKLRMTFELSGERIIMRNVGEHDKVLKRP